MLLLLAAEVIYLIAVLPNKHPYEPAHSYHNLGAVAKLRKAA
jgi:hypothetical protein